MEVVTRDPSHNMSKDTEVSDEAHPPYSVREELADGSRGELLSYHQTLDEAKAAVPKRLDKRYVICHQRRIIWRRIEKDF